MASSAAQKPPTVRLKTAQEHPASSSGIGAVWRRFRRHRMAVVGLFVLTGIILYITVGSLIFSEDFANQTSIRDKWAAPTAEHPMGTDSVGRDIMARTIYGGQISLAISVLSVTVTVTLGTLMGLLAGYYGGVVDSIITRIAEALFVIPTLFLLLVLSKFIGGRMPDVVILGRAISGSVFVIILVLGFTSWMGLTRIIRAVVLSLKQQEFIIAARALGANDSRIIFHHILPNVLAPVIVSATLGIAGSILVESYVSFLGLGVQPPTASWGNMIQRAAEKIDTAWWLWAFPGGLILLTILSINFIGDGMRDALDRRSKE
ncbi:MAG: ABC transporter permease [Chloroflexota bacterium]